MLSQQKPRFFGITWFCKITDGDVRLTPKSELTAELMQSTYDGELGMFLDRRENSDQEASVWRIPSMNALLSAQIPQGSLVSGIEVGIRDPSGPKKPYKLLSKLSLLDIYQMDIDVQRPA